MTTELFVKLQFSAMHSLEENEAVHPHIWRVLVGLRGEVENGRILSLPLARTLFDEALGQIRNSLLNENLRLNTATRKNPTCENLCEFLFQEFSKVLKSVAESRSFVHSVEVGVIEEDGVELGFARYS